MITDSQVRRLRKMKQQGKELGLSAAKAGMDEKTARKYLRLDKLPSEIRADHTWKTRKDVFKDVWKEVKAKLELNNGLEAKAIFGYLQRKYPGKFEDGQLRTLQRRLKVWRATEGPSKEIYFEQKHEPGKLCESDFSSMNKVGIRIGGVVFDHLIYHFVLSYSNWEMGNICFSESFESLSYGLQNALWKLGKVPKEHQTDRLSTAVNKNTNPEEFTRRYQALLDYYGVKGRKTNPASPHENGDIEQRHYRFKKALEQSLLLRGSSDFQSREEYADFLEKLFIQLNSGRQRKLKEELFVMKTLPTCKLDSFKIMQVKVSKGSTVRVNHNVYSVNSRLIGEQVKVKLYAEYLEVWYSQRCIERLPRLRGEGKHRINYRHIIEWLIRKPGAFENYRYREDLFPTSRFRIAYDYLKKKHAAGKAIKEYLKLLYFAFKEGEELVDDTLLTLIENGVDISKDSVEADIEKFRNEESVSRAEVKIDEVNLEIYDKLLDKREAV